MVEVTLQALLLLSYSYRVSSFAFCYPSRRWWRRCRSSETCQAKDSSPKTERRDVDKILRVIRKVTSSRIWCVTCYFNFFRHCGSYVCTNRNKHDLHKTQTRASLLQRHLQRFEPELFVCVIVFQHLVQFQFDVFHQSIISADFWPVK